MYEIPKTAVQNRRMRIMVVMEKHEILKTAVQIIETGNLAVSNVQMNLSNVASVGKNDSQIGGLKILDC